MFAHFLYHIFVCLQKMLYLCKLFGSFNVKML